MLDNMTEGKEFLTFGKIEVDVSNVSNDRLIKARVMWDELFQLGKERETPLTAEDYNNVVNKIGAFLIGQDFSVLRRRFTFWQSVKEYFKRTFILTPKYINKSLKKDYDAFHNWISVQVTGKTLEQIKKNNEMEMFAMKIRTKMEEMGVTLDQCEELLLTLLQEQAGKLNISTPTQKK